MSDTFSDFLADVEPRIEQRESEVAQALPETKERERRSREARDVAVAELGRTPGSPKPPELAPASRQPQLPEPDALKMFSNIGTAFAAFASLLTRQPMTTALKAGGAAALAYRKGELEQAAAYRNQWMDAVEAAQRQNALELQRYHATIEAAGNDLRARLANVQAFAAAHRDDAMTLSATIAQQDALLKLRADYGAKLARIAGTGRLRASDIAYQNWLDMVGEEEGKRKAAGRPPLSAREKNTLWLEAQGKASKSQSVQKSGAALQEADQLVQDMLQTVQQHPAVVGAYGKASRYGGSAIEAMTMGQYAPEFMSRAEKFHTDVAALIAKLREYVGARYFSAPTRSFVENLVTGTGWLETPARVTASLQELHRLIQRDMEGAANEPSSLQGLSDEELIRRYNESAQPEDEE